MKSRNDTLKMKKSIVFYIILIKNVYLCNCKT